MTQTRDEAAPTAKRRYRSPLREQQAQQTRTAVLDAATRLFATNGWAATGMRDIAREAGVSTETLYAHFSSKADLLRRAADVAVVGDEALVPLAERAEFAALGQGSRADRIAAAAQLATGLNRRTAGFAKVIREAATADEAMAESLTATRERQRLDTTAGFELIVGRGPTPAERDGLWAVLSPEVYLLLVEESGWSPEEYEAWLTGALDALIPRR